MNMKKNSILLILVGLLCCFSAEAFQSFTVKSIRVIGLQRISKGAVLDDLPVQIGQTVSQESAAEAVRALYKTGFFKDITLSRDGDTLVVHVTERPTISKLTLSGIKDKDKVKKLLREIGLAEGQLYDPALVLQAEKELERYYYSRGRYGVKIESNITEEAGSLVNVQFSIYEGDVAKIQEIKIIGNHAFTEKELVKQFRLSKTNWLSWFTNDDQYNREKLNADLEILRSYYMDRGYLNFQIDSSQVTLSSDKKHIFIAIHVTEGAKYTFGHVSLEGDFVVPKEKLLPYLAAMKSGTTFSRKVLLEVKQALETRMGDDGYSLAEARPTHEENEKDKQVDIVFHLTPGKRMYVRRIIIEGNSTTKDEVLRRELPQLEGTWISTALVREGREKIMRRGYGSEVEIDTLPIPGTDQVDLLYKIEEARLGQVGLGLGYSPSEKLMFNFSLSQENFFGTGKGVDFNFDQSKASTTYALGYQDPYFTVDGIGMGASGYFNKSDLSKTTDLTSYTADTLGGEVRWVFPMTKFEVLRFSLGYDDTRLKIDQRFASQEVNAFVNQFGSNFSEFKASVGWNYDSLDQRIFPKRGMLQSAGITGVIPGANQQYYKLAYDVYSYHPITESELWIVSLQGNLGFGNGYGKTSRMPFYRNFTAGGTKFVRGFEENSLGPKDSQGRAFGGNTLVAGTAAFIFPNPIKPDAKSVRTSLFLDAGQVYDTRFRTTVINGVRVSRNPQGLRYSVGVSLSWHTPLGGAPLSFSLAKPLNVKSGDKKRPFTFWMGTNF